MTEKTMRLNKVLRELNISLDRAVEFLSDKGIKVEARPTTKISGEVYEVLLNEFETDKEKKIVSKEVGEEKKKEKEELRLAQEAEIEKKRKEQESRQVVKAVADKPEIKTVGKIDLPGATEVVKDNASEEAEEVSQGQIKENGVDATNEKEEKVEETVVEEPVAEKKPEVSIVPEETVKPTAETPKVDLPKEEKQEPSKEKTQTEAPKEKEVKQEEKEVVANKKEEKKEETSAVSSNNTEEKSTADSGTIKTEYRKLTGPKLTGAKIDLKQFERPKKKKPANGQADNKNNQSAEKKKRKRIAKPNQPNPNNRNNSNNRNNKSNNQNRGRRPVATKEEPTDEEVQRQVRETLERLQGKGQKNKGAKYRREKRESHRQQTNKSIEEQQAESKLLKVTEFVTVGEIATMMNVSPTQIISTCMTLGMMVTMNQRLDAETLTIVADEFGYQVEFVGAEVEESIVEDVDDEKDLKSRAPIITVMGHVDHGKTSLLDYIREANVIAGESGGITQHIGAYSVELKGGQVITFLDTPGHEAFTAMRARGAQVTDLAIIVIAADDDVMPQTKEAISHAQAANVPIVFAINKVDKPTANPDNVKQQLASMNLLVEDWGGKIQSHDISAKTGQGVDELLEKVLLEAEILDLKANPDKRASGTVVEALLDKGRGYVSTILVQGGTLKIGDYVLAGTHSGKVRAMFDERGNNIKEAGPSTPVSLLGLDGAPQAGDRFNVFEDEREAKQIANKRSQLQREQSVRTQRHITLDEIGRRIALGDFKELNIILKGDVDGSVEALTDSFLKLSTDEIQINIIHKGVGAITESDVLLASASDAVVIGFNVRPQGNARSLADTEEVDIRTYSIIYDAINDLKDAMEGMLSPEMKEEITGNAEIREVYKISKVGNIAGCMVVQGKVFRDSKVRIIREGIVIHDGTLATLKRFKDDVKEVAKGYDCGIQIKNYNDIAIGDIIEAYQEVAVKKKL